MKRGGVESDGDDNYIRVSGGGSEERGSLGDTQIKSMPVFG